MKYVPFFPVIFLETDEIDPELFGIMRSTKDFSRFLKNNKDITPIEGRDLALLQHFLRFGQIADTSVVTFNENDRICVKSGPLQGLEGFVVKVDKRKQRAKISLDFANENFVIDLAFNILEEKGDDEL